MPQEIPDLAQTSNNLWNLSYFLGLPEASVSGCGAYLGLWQPAPAVCRILCSNARCWGGNLSDLTVDSPQYDIPLCSETLVSDMHHVSELLVPRFGCLVLLWEGKMPQARGIAAYTWDCYGEFHQPKFESGCCQIVVFRVCGVRQNLYVFSIYRNPDRHNRILIVYWHQRLLCTENARASFQFVGNLNGHHLEWLGSTTLNRHGVAANCRQLRSVGFWPKQCTWWNTWPPDD